MRRAAAALVLLVGLTGAACSSGGGGAEAPPPALTGTVATTVPVAVQQEIDDQITARIATQDGCADLAKGLASRLDDLAKEAERPGYIPADRLPLVQQRVEVAQARMAELGCPQG